VVVNFTCPVRDTGSIIIINIISISSSTHEGEDW